MKYSVAFATALIVSFGSTAIAEERLPSREEFHLFLLIGQSNMAGRGKVEDQDRQVIPRVLMLNEDEQWAPAIDPLHFDKPSIVGVGIGRSFAAELAKAHRGITIGLIPCAVGGSPIASWAPGQYYAPTKSHPYDDMARRLDVALQSGELRGILWHQGESDAKPGKADVYEKKLHALIARLRSQFDAPNIPFITGQMGSFEERPWDDAKRMVDAAHRTLPDKVSKTAFVPSDGLDHKGDQVHFDAASYRALGRRYARAYIRLLADQTPKSE